MERSFPPSLSPQNDLWGTGAKLKENALTFAAFKTHHQQKQLVAELLDTQGNPKSFAKFRKDTAKIVRDYNVAYLRAEYNTAVRASLMAKKWHAFEQDQDLFPNLIYRASRSASVRESHRKLWGTIRPIDDPFWDTFLPPNGWNCKCSVANTDQATTPIKASQEELALMKPPPGIAGNPGKSKQIYTPENTFTKQTTTQEKKQVQTEVERRLANETAHKVRDWAKTNIVGKVEITLKELEGGKVRFKNSDIKAITGKPHKNRAARNQLLYNIEKHLTEAQFITKAKEAKNRDKYLEWFYYKKEIEGVPYYFNIGKRWVNSGKSEQGYRYELHAITDKGR